MSQAGWSDPGTVRRHEWGRTDSGQVAAPQRLRNEVDEALERLSGLLLRAAVGTAGLAVEKAGNGAGPARIQETVRFLGQVVSGWPDPPEDALPDEGAGYGSTVVVEDVEAARTAVR